MDKKFLFMVYGIYLALVCVISGVWSAVTLAEILEVLLDILWPLNTDDFEYYTPSTMRDLVEALLHLIISVPIFFVHLNMFRKEIKEK